jgi:hypothetical protein
MELPGLHPHPLKGDDKGLWSASGNWRVIFRFEDNSAVDIDYLDYHSKAFGGSAESWLNQQTQYDLWQAMQKEGDFEVTAFA